MCNRLIESIVCVCLAVLEPILEGDKAKDYLAMYVNPTLLRGLGALCQHKPAEPIVSCKLLLSLISDI